MLARPPFYKCTTLFYNFAISQLFPNAWCKYSYLRCATPLFTLISRFFPLWSFKILDRLKCDKIRFTLFKPCDRLICEVTRRINGKNVIPLFPHLPSLSHSLLSLLFSFMRHGKLHIGKPSNPFTTVLLLAESARSRARIRSDYSRRRGFWRESFSPSDRGSAVRRSLSRPRARLLWGALRRVRQPKKMTAWPSNRRRPSLVSQRLRLAHCAGPWDINPPKIVFDSVAKTILASILTVLF